MSGPSRAAIEMRIFLIDDVHKDAFLREWAELSQVERLHEALDRSHRGLAHKLTLPLPAPELTEEIVRLTPSQPAA